jgi:hypothetical protein
LKPDVCRRVVGRLPSPHIQISLQKPFWFQQRGMAPPFSLRIPLRTNPKGEEKFMVVYLVRSFRTYARIRSLTTGTFNLVVKDRIAFRLSGAPSGLDGPAARANPAVLETLQTYRSHPTLSTPASHSISTRFPHGESAQDARPGAQPPKSLVILTYKPTYKVVIPSGLTARNLLFGGTQQRATI